MKSEVSEHSRFFILISDTEFFTKMLMMQRKIFLIFLNFFRKI